MKVKLINDSLDSNGDIFRLEKICIDKKDTSRITDKLPIPITINFDNSKQVGKCIELFDEEDGLYATLEFNNDILKEKGFTMYPVIQGEILKSHEENGVRVIDSYRLMSVEFIIKN